MLTTVPGLDDVAVRKAIATAMPRQQIVDRVVKDANDDAVVLDNTMWMTNQKQYEPNWSMYPKQGDVAAAKTMLDAAGWMPGSDGVRAKDGVKLAFTVGTTTGNKAREFSEQIIQEQLKKIGVKITIKNSPDMLDTKIVGFDYQTIIFAWVGSPDPYSNNVIWLSGAIPERCSPRLAKAEECDYSGLNYTKTKDPTLDEILNATDREPDPVEAGGALQPGRPPDRAERRDRRPAVPEAHPARVPQHHHRRAGQPHRGRLHLEHRRLGR